MNLLLRSAVPHGHPVCILQSSLQWSPTTNEINFVHWRSSLLVSTRGSKRSTLRKIDQLSSSPHLASCLRSKAQKELSHVQRALHFCDDHYTKVYGDKWYVMRLAMMTQDSNKCALGNNFATNFTDTTIMDNEEVVDLGKLYLENVIDEDDDSTTFEDDHSLHKSHRSTKKDDDYNNNDDDESSAPLPVLSSSSSASRLISVEEQILGDSEWDASALHDFVPSKTLMGTEGFHDEHDYYDKYQHLRTNMMPALNLVRKKTTIFPEHLRLYMSKDPTWKLKQPLTENLKDYQNLPYLCFNPASLIQVLALDLRPNDTVLVHNCKAIAAVLALLQTLLPSKVVCNLAKIRGKGEQLRSFLKAFDNESEEISRTLETISVEPQQICLIKPHAFKKVLLEAPCFEDRRSLHDNSNNLFNPKRKRDRIVIAEKQAALLVSAIKCLEVGGSVVYSTRTLSPVQNDGVVMDALRTLWDETKINVVVEDLRPTLTPLSSLLEVQEGTDCKLGCLITPSILKNVGPLYLSRITRTP